MNKNGLYLVKTTLLIITTFCLIVLTSCTTVKGIFGKSSSKELKQSNKIEQVQQAQNKNTQSKLEQVSVLASGTDYALNKVTNREPNVDVAQDINKRVLSLSGQPNIEAEKEMWKLVDNLTSQVSEERKKGEKSLEKKDKEIQKLQTESKDLLSEKDKEIAKYMKISQDTALLADKRKQELDDYQGWFGLKAVGKGLWQFITSMAWIIGGMALLYLILRAFASTNPVVGAIFSIVEQIAAGFIKIIQGIAPKASEFAKLVPQTKFNSYRQTLDKLIDVIELLKDSQKRIGKDYTLNEVLIEFSKVMNDDDKERVEEVKKNNGWY
jgi:predicted RND superfamily exporter protein